MNQMFYLPSDTSNDHLQLDCPCIRDNYDSWVDGDIENIWYFIEIFFLPEKFILILSQKKIIKYYFCIFHFRNFGLEQTEICHKFILTSKIFFSLTWSQWDLVTGYLFDA